MLRIKDYQIEKFKSILESKPAKKTTKEQCIQNYLEKYSDMIPINLVLNHNVLFDFIISKLSINTGYKCDFAYLTKSSDNYRLVLIELEDSDKKNIYRFKKKYKISF